MFIFSPIFPSIGFILQGALVTLKFTSASLLCGLPLGILLAACKLGHVRTITFLANAYTSVFRGTPLLVQLGIVYYGLPQLMGYAISAFEAGVLVFALNSAAYTSEIIRGGVESIDIGQWHAAQVLGISKSRTFIKIILPQAMRNILPSLVNEMVDLLKESAIVSTIGEMDLLKRGQLVAAEKFLYFEPLIIVASIYFVMVMIMSQGAKILESKLKYA